MCFIICIDALTSITDNFVKGLIPRSTKQWVKANQDVKLVNYNNKLFKLEVLLFE